MNGGKGRGTLRIHRWRGQFRVCLWWDGRNTEGNEGCKRKGGWEAPPALLEEGRGREREKGRGGGVFVETKGKAASLFRDGRGGLLEAAVESERQGLYAYGRRSREARGGARKGGGRGGRRCCAWPDATGQRLDRTFSAVSSRTRHIREQIIWPRSSLDHGWLPRLDPSLSLLARSFSSAHGRSSPAAAASTLRPRLSRARSGCRPVADLASQVTRPCPYPCVHVFLCVWARAEHSWPNKRALSYYLHIQ